MVAMETVAAAPDRGTLVLTRDDVRRLLSMPDCVDAVELAFRRHANGQTIAPGVLGAHVEGGGFHVKTAGMLATVIAERPVFVAKVNANFPGNPDRFGIPTIQGIIALFDAHDGRPLALLDSGEITSMRTAAATAVAARYLAREDADTVTICGCGEQSRHQLRALGCVRPIRDVVAFDTNAERATRFADEMARELGVSVVVAHELDERARRSAIWVTCTTATRWFVGRDHVAPGAFVAAVGADNPHKQEIEPELLASATVVADVLDQCVAIGDLHHAIEGRVMSRVDVHAELADVVAAKKRGRSSPNEITVFDSTGTALEDVAAAATVYARACARGEGTTIHLAGGRIAQPVDPVTT